MLNKVTIYFLKLCDEVITIEETIEQKLYNL